MNAIPGERLIIYPGGGHAFHWEDPTALARDLVAFVDETQNAAAQPPAGM